jgi:hypothetical protein
VVVFELDRGVRAVLISVFSRVIRPGCRSLSIR